MFSPPPPQNKPPVVGWMSAPMIKGQLVNGHERIRLSQRAGMHVARVWRYGKVPRNMAHIPLEW